MKSVFLRLRALILAFVFVGGLFSLSLQAGAQQQNPSQTEPAPEKPLVLVDNLFDELLGFMSGPESPHSGESNSALLPKSLGKALQKAVSAMVPKGNPAERKSSDG